MIACHLRQAVYVTRPWSVSRIMFMPLCYWVYLKCVPAFYRESSMANPIFHRIQQLVRPEFGRVRDQPEVEREDCGKESFSHPSQKLLVRQTRDFTPQNGKTVGGECTVVKFNNILRGFFCTKVFCADFLYLHYSY